MYHMRHFSLLVLLAHVFRLGRVVDARTMEGFMEIRDIPADDGTGSLPTLYDHLMEGDKMGKYSAVITAMNGTTPNLLNEMKSPQKKYTLFIPNDDVIGDTLSDSLRAKLQEPEWRWHLYGLLTHHMLGKQLLTADWMTPTEDGNVEQGRTDIPEDANLSPSLESSILFFTNRDGGFQVEGLPVLEEDMLASNGVIHEIGGLLGVDYFRSTIDTQGAAFSDYSKLYEYGHLVGLGEVATGPGPNTILAPNNAAMAHLDLDLNKDDDVDKLRQIMEYHVLPGRNIHSRDISQGMELETLLSGQTLKVTEQGFNEAHVVTGNILMSNGVIHTINKVMIPPSLSDRCLLRCEEWCAKDKVKVCHNGKEICISINAWKNGNCFGEDTCGKCDDSEAVY